MSAEVISMVALVAMFVVAAVLPINMGLLGLVGAFLVGTLVAGVSAETIMDGFPVDLFLTLLGVTYLFAIAQNNGTIDWLVQLGVRAVGGRVAAIPWVMFVLAALLTAAGALSPAAVAIVAPVAMGFAVQHGISQVLVGLMVVHGAQAGAFSPIGVFGGITNGVVQRAGLPADPIVTMLGSLAVNLGLALVLFLYLGGPRLVGRRAVPPVAPAEAALGQAAAVPRSVAVAVPAWGPQVYGDAEATAKSQWRQEATAAPDSLLAERPTHPLPSAGPTLARVVTAAGLVALAVLTLAFGLHIGLVSITIGLLLAAADPERQKRALAQVSWPEITLIVGVSTYVGVLERMGTIDWLGRSVAGFASPLLAALLLCVIGATVSAFASSTALLGSLIPLSVPFLAAGTGVGPVGLVAAMAVASTVVDVSPFSTSGALVLASYRGADRETFFRRLLQYGVLVTVAAPIVTWLLFVVPGWP